MQDEPGNWRLTIEKFISVLSSRTNSACFLSFEKNTKRSLVQTAAGVSGTVALELAGTRITNEATHELSTLKRACRPESYPRISSLCAVFIAKLLKAASLSNGTKTEKTRAN